MILITGGHGFIGKYIIKELKKKKIKFKAPDKKNLNINNNIQIKKINNKFDTIIHAAALCGADESNKSYKNFIDTNFNGTKNIIFRMIEAKINNLIFFSSLTVFGNSNQRVNENSEYKSRHVYSLSKILCEKFIQTFCKLHNINFIILRPTLVVGKGYKEPHAIGDFVQTLLQNKKILIYGSGDHKRDFIHPSDVAAATVKSFYLLKKKKNFYGNSFNLTNNEVIKIKNLAKITKNVIGKGYILFSKKTKKTFSLYSNSNKAKKYLNWKPKMKNIDIINELNNE
jgi:nucleoside-diphosphate-sugar epimerase